jgi:hypothetical protein
VLRATQTRAALLLCFTVRLEDGGRDERQG